ncbi:serine hydrolase FSH [Aspergillus leporis]|jgi:hypothetical protein|uniref:Serine hydrolase FSH n=1 Tax=Aspergillus leporis TaxID=41062 RepID=A0A5N5WVD1_9EURO|nr:serine hydrolase FSH [Aspergillus leporis]
MWPSLREVTTTTTDSFYSYLDSNNITSCSQALDLLGAYIQAEGPFDGVFAFSQGVIVTASYLARKAKEDPEAASPFKCAVLFSAAAAYGFSEEERLRVLRKSLDGKLIRVPMVHVWGRGDESIELDEDKGLECY